MMRIYHYDPNTGAACGSSDADADPLGDGWLLPAWATIVEPPEADPGCTVHWIDGAWQQVGIPAAAPDPQPTMEYLRSARDAMLSAACSDAITAGLTVDAIGAPIYYPTAQTDQINLSGAVTLTLLPDLPADWAQHLTCRDESGVWARRPHTAAQVQAVGRAVAAHVDACRARLDERREALATAETAAEVAAVEW